MIAGTGLLIAAMPLLAVNKKMSEIDEQALKLTAVVTGCDMDEFCIISMLKELTKKDHNPLFKKYLEISDLYKEQMDKNMKICRTPQTVAYKKELSNCMAEQFKKADLDKVSNEKIDKEMKECMIKNMNPLGSTNNMYAQATLAQSALEAKDTKQYQYWITMLRGQAKSNNESAVFDKCGPDLGLSAKIMSEALFSVAKDLGTPKP